MHNFIAIGICFLFGTIFTWHEETDTCFNVECMLHDRNYDFRGDYLVAIGITTGSCLLPGG